MQSHKLRITNGQRQWHNALFSVSHTHLDGYRYIVYLHQSSSFTSSNSSASIFRFSVVLLLLLISVLHFEIKCARAAVNLCARSIATYCYFQTFDFNMILWPTNERIWASVVVVVVRVCHLLTAKPQQMNAQIEIIEIQMQMKLLRKTKALRLPGGVCVLGRSVCSRYDVRRSTKYFLLRSWCLISLE